MRKSPDRSSSSSLKNENTFLQRNRRSSAGFLSPNGPEWSGWVQVRFQPTRKTAFKSDKKVWKEFNKSYKLWDQMKRDFWTFKLRLIGWRHFRWSNQNAAFSRHERTFKSDLISLVLSYENSDFWVILWFWSPILWVWFLFHSISSDLSLMDRRNLCEMWGCTFFLLRLNNISAFFVEGKPGGDGKWMWAGPRWSPGFAHMTTIHQQKH